jgi:hypothetical protein
MRYIFALCVMLVPLAASAAGNTVKYDVNGKPYEGYYISPKPDAPFL